MFLIAIHISFLLLLVYYNISSANLFLLDEHSLRPLLKIGLIFRQHSSIAKSRTVCYTHTYHLYERRSLRFVQNYRYETDSKNVKYTRYIFPVIHTKIIYATQKDGRPKGKYSFSLHKHTPHTHIHTNNFALYFHSLTDDSHEPQCFHSRKNEEFWCEM